MFPAPNIKIMIYEDLLQDRVRYLAEIFDFPDVGNQVRPPSLNQRIAGTKALPPTLRRVFYKHLAPLLRRPLILNAWRATKLCMGLKRIHPTAGEAKAKYPAMTGEDRRRLQNAWRDGNAKLFDVLDRQLEEWCG
jgi:hypothetical protein